jgi:6,7-dimethyl-8-ribityllumazine synthase
MAIVAAEFNEEIASAMVRAATSAAHQAEFEVRVVRVPGCYELPLAVAISLDDATIDAVVVLGYIEQGETLHGEVMGHVVHRALVDLSLAHRRPIGIGIIGPGATLAQANSRKESYAASAVQAVARVVGPRPGGASATASRVE